jgi:hypothetical protein
MNYKLKPSVNIDLFDIVETNTNQIVLTSNQKDAMMFMRHLNLGGGFDGWTPAFLLKKIVISEQKTR